MNDFKLRKEIIKMKKNFVRFMSPGTFVGETREKEIDSWDVRKAVAMSREITERYGSKPYGFYFVTKERKDDEWESKVVASSGVYYINGKIETLEELKAKNDPNNRILIDNMQMNHWNRVVTTYNPWKWTQPFHDKDHIVNV